MKTLTKNDLQYIIGALNHAAEEYSKALNEVQASGLKRIYAMQLERNQALAATLQDALDKGAKRIAIG